MKYGVLRVTAESIGDIWERAVEGTRGTFANLGVAVYSLGEPLSAAGRSEAVRRAFARERHAVNFQLPRSNSQTGCAWALGVGGWVLTSALSTVETSG
jgi:hypothetical protein